MRSRVRRRSWVVPWVASKSRNWRTSAWAAWRIARSWAAAATACTAETKMEFSMKSGWPQITLTYGPTASALPQRKCHPGPPFTSTCPRQLVG